jgi:hypothetical protein
MKRMMAVVGAALFLIAAAAPADARGHGGGGRGGGHSGGGVRGGGHGSHGGRFPGHHFHGHGFRSSVFIGVGPYWGPYWYPPYYPYYPYAAYEPVPVVSEPQTYIQQPGAASYWYYCEAAKAYYPYVRECPGGWLTVLPQAAPESQQ